MRRALKALVIITIVPTPLAVHKYVISLGNDHCLSLFLSPPLFSFLFLSFQLFFPRVVWIACYSRFVPRLSVEPASGLLFLPFPRRTWKIAVYFAAVIAFSLAELLPVYALRQRLMN